MKSCLGNLRLYKFDAPCVSDAAVMIVSFEGGHISERFQLTRYTGRVRGRGSKAGFSKAFVDKINSDFMLPCESNIPNQFFDYIVSNFSFKNLKMLPPACPALVFHFNTRKIGQDHVPEIDITRMVVSELRTRDSVLSVEHAKTRLVPIDPPNTEILDYYQSPELCFLCEKGYPKEDEIVHKTKCNHIFHGSCISRYLLHTPQCPVCSAELLPVDIRTLLFI